MTEIKKESEDEETKINDHLQVSVSCGLRIIKIIYFINDDRRNSEALNDSRGV